MPFVDRESYPLTEIEQSTARFDAVDGVEIAAWRDGNGQFVLARGGQRARAPTIELAFEHFFGERAYDIVNRFPKLDLLKV
jgi:hypothetical protein